MGLDSYAMNRDGKCLTKEQESLFEGINLCGGLFSGNGGSFRGKVYNSFIQEISGVSLYSEMLEVCEVTCIKEALEDHLANGNPLVDVSEDTVSNLLRFFKVCDENDLVVGGWW